MKPRLSHYDIAVKNPCRSTIRAISFLLCMCVGITQAFGALSRLSISSNHRYLQDASGTPFFLVGDCPQNLPIKMAISEMDAFLLDCKNKGFNLLWVCIDGQRALELQDSIKPKDRNGNLMMKSGWDISSLNDAYFVTIDTMLNKMEAHEIYAMLTPLSECHWTQANINSNDAGKWHDYGTFLGNRYKNMPHIIWQFGNDNINKTAQHAIVRGIKEAGDTHLMTVNWRPGYHELGSAWVRKHHYGEDWIDLDAWYENAITTESGAACYWQKIEYERAHPMPSFQTEGPYQQPDPKNASDLDIRMQNYYVALGGGCGGHVYGSGWMADAWDYDTYINNGGRLQTIHFKNLFVSRDWTSLVPDYEHSFITEGYGTLSMNTLDYVGAAINSGTLGMAYCPQAVTITANMSKFSGKVTARWYDPTNGSYKSIDGSPFSNKGLHQFTTPGINNAKSGDWVLVLESNE
ncbi:MAG TPA: DUF4038 domain-containing protein [Terriglobia bacterium]|nr:DUF4038 domain-containing protein [Terriglobia bacterium]